MDTFSWALPTRADSSTRYLLLWALSDGATCSGSAATASEEGAAMSEESKGYRGDLRVLLNFEYRYDSDNNPYATLSSGYLNRPVLDT